MHVVLILTSTSQRICSKIHLPNPAQPSRATVNLQDGCDAFVFYGSDVLLWSSHMYLSREAGIASRSCCCGGGRVS